MGRLRILQVGPDAPKAGAGAPLILQQAPRRSVASALVVGLLACGDDDPARKSVRVRGGRVVDQRGVDEGRPIAAGRRLIPDGEALATGEDAPERPGCVSVFSQPLGDVDGWIAMGGEPPDTALAFDPSGDRLAVGTWTGGIWVFDAWTGEVLARERLAEAVVKRVAWSPDGQILYAAEQSPDAWVLALDPATLAVRARLRMADHVETSAPPPGDDLYGVYGLPAAYALEVIESGELVVSATHGWNDAGGVRRNRARVLRLGPELDLRAAWPPGRAAEAVVLSTALHGSRVAVSLTRSADGPAPVDVPVDGVLILTLPDLTPERSVRIPPLEPWFDRTFVWEAVGLGDNGAVAVGLGDGRVAWSDPGGALDVLGLGAPIQLGDLAVSASVAELALVGERAYVLTGGTNIPFGTAHPDLRPPETHPDENALFALDHGPGGWRLVWAWRGPHDLAGLTVAPDARWLVLGGGVRARDARTDLFGALILGLEGDARPTPIVCATSGPVFFRHAIAADGRIAVAEHPWRDGDTVRGDYRVTVLR